MVKFDEGEAEAGQFWFRARGMASVRERLALSIEGCGLILGASGKSVYSWECGETKAHSEDGFSSATQRGAGKRDLAARLNAFGQLQCRQNCSDGPLRASIPGVVEAGCEDDAVSVARQLWWERLERG